MSEHSKLTCYTCGGTGTNPMSDSTHSLPCHACEGTGKSDWRPAISGERHTELAHELAELVRWKAEMLEVESQWDCQAVGKLLGATLGDHIRPIIEPKVRALLLDLDRGKQIVREALDKMDHYVNRKSGNRSTGEHYPAIQSIMDRMRDHLSRP